MDAAVATSRTSGVSQPQSAGSASIVFTFMDGNATASSGPICVPSQATGCACGTSGAANRERIGHDFRVESSAPDEHVVRMADHHPAVARREPGLHRAPSSTRCPSISTAWIHFVTPALSARSTPPSAEGACFAPDAPGLVRATKANRLTWFLFLDSRRNRGGSAREAARCPALLRPYFRISSRWRRQVNSHIQDTVPLCALEDVVNSITIR